MGMTLKELLTKGEGTLTAGEAKHWLPSAGWMWKRFTRFWRSAAVKILDVTTMPRLRSSRPRCPAPVVT